MTSFASQRFEGIVTCDEDSGNILRGSSPFIVQQDWSLVSPAVEKLLHVRETILKGGAGLAAPQIGISLPIFIYTPDRTTENLRVVVNPSFEPASHVKIKGYEACYSVPLRCTTLARWEKIKVRYQNLNREWVEDTVEGFEAKVFQHEMDHLQGKLTIDHETAEVMTFTDPHAFQEHMKQIHLEDSKTYKKN